MKKIYLLAIVTMCTVAAVAQQKYEGQISYTPDVVRSGDNVTIKINHDFGKLRLKRQQMIVITPELVSQDGANSATFAPVVVAGSRRYKALQRDMAYGKNPFGDEPYTILRYRRNKGQDIFTNNSIPAAGWITYSQLSVNEEVSGCVNCRHSVRDQTLIAAVFAPQSEPKTVVSLPRFEPQTNIHAPQPQPGTGITVPGFEPGDDINVPYVDPKTGVSDPQAEPKTGTDGTRPDTGIPASMYSHVISELVVAYVTPPAEPVKERSETHVSHVNYPLNRHELLRNFRNNAELLDQVDAIMTELTDNRDLTITNFTVTGFASPEGITSNNMALSARRTESFLAYLINNFGYNTVSVASQSKGEDWDGLYDAVSKSSMQDREAVMSIIRNTTDIAKRKRELQTLSGGRTYRTMLQTIYPTLRRSEYAITYVTRPFNIEEAKTLIKTRPEHLSLNEMYLVANTYMRNSKDFRAVLDIIYETYPDDVYANFYKALQEMENGDTDSAITRLEKYEMPEALNNLAIAYSLKGDYEKTLEYLRKAADAGSEDARYNLELFESSNSQTK